MALVPLNSGDGHCSRLNVGASAVHKNSVGAPVRFSMGHLRDAATIGAKSSPPLHFPAKNISLPWNKKRTGFVIYLNAISRSFELRYARSNQIKRRPR